STCVPTTSTNGVNTTNRSAVVSVPTRYGRRRCAGARNATTSSSAQIAATGQIAAASSAATANAASSAGAGAAPTCRTGGGAPARNRRTVTRRRRPAAEVPPEHVARVRLHVGGADGALAAVEVVEPVALSDERAPDAVDGLQVATAVPRRDLQLPRDGADPV